MLIKHCSYDILYDCEITILQMKFYNKPLCILGISWTNDHSFLLAYSCSILGLWLTVMILAPGCLRETVEQMSMPVCSTEFVWDATICRDHRSFLWNHWWNILILTLITEHLPFRSHAVVDNIMIWEEKINHYLWFHSSLNITWSSRLPDVSIGTKSPMKWGTLDKVISKVDSSYPTSFCIYIIWCHQECFKVKDRKVSPRQVIRQGGKMKIHIWDIESSKAVKEPGKSRMRSTRVERMIWSVVLTV